MNPSKAITTNKALKTLTLPKQAIKDSKMNEVIFKKRLKDGNFLTARYKHNKNGGMIRVLVENSEGSRVSIPYCPKGYPMCIFVNGKSKTAFNKALVKANNLASINN